MWVEDVVITTGGYRGKLGNEPLEITSLKLGQEVLVPLERVSDWMAVDDGTLVGGFTLRVLRDRMPADERAAFDAANGIRIEE
jgi:uncharacterized protein YegJ (DUF2314 family)